MLSCWPKPTHNHLQYLSFKTFLTGTASKITLDSGISGALGWKIKGNCIPRDQSKPHFSPDWSLKPMYWGLFASEPAAIQDHLVFLHPRQLCWHWGIWHQVSKCLIWWVENHCPKPPDQVTPVFHQHQSWITSITPGWKKIENQLIDLTDDQFQEKYEKKKNGRLDTGEDWRPIDLQYCNTLPTYLTFIPTSMGSWDDRCKETQAWGIDLRDLLALINTPDHFIVVHVPRSRLLRSLWMQASKAKRLLE